MSRGQVRRVTPGDLGFDAAELFAQRVDAVGDGSEPLFLEGFQFDGLEVEDLELVFAAPGNEGGLGDVEFGHQARISPAAGAQFYEALDGLFVVHTVLSCRRVGRSSRLKAELRTVQLEPAIVRGSP